MTLSPVAAKLLRNTELGGDMMSVIEFSGGQINHRYLMGKSKNDLAHMVLDYLTVWEKSQADVKRLTQELAAARRPPMQPIDQSIVTPTEGDCMRATVATLLDLPLDAVPHFMRFPGDEWWRVYVGFFWALGWEIGEWKTEGAIDPDSGVNGFFDAAVPSKTFPDKKHAVVIDSAGVVVHDPNPNRAWMGANVLESGELIGYYTMKRITE